MMDSPSISYVRRNSTKVIASLDMGAEILSKLAQSALGDGASSVSLHVEDGIYSISSNRSWLVREAFEVMVPYPELAVNSCRFEILVSAFADWFSLTDESGEIFSHGMKPAIADSYLSRIKCPQALIFYINPDPSRQLWRTMVKAGPSPA